MKVNKIVNSVVKKCKKPKQLLLPFPKKKPEKVQLTFKFPKPDETKKLDKLA